MLLGWASVGVIDDEVIVTVVVAVAEVVVDDVDCLFRISTAGDACLYATEADDDDWFSKHTRLGLRTAISPSALPTPTCVP